MPQYGLSVKGRNHMSILQKWEASITELEAKDFRGPVAQYDLYVLHAKVEGYREALAGDEVKALLEAARALAQYVSEENPGARSGDAWVGKLVDDAEAAIAAYKGEKP